MGPDLIVAQCYADLDAGQSLSVGQCADISRVGASDPALLTLAVRLVYKRRNHPEEQLLYWIVSNHAPILSLLRGIFEESHRLFPELGPTQARVDAEDIASLRRIRLHQPVGGRSFARLVQRPADTSTSFLVAAMLLALVHAEGLPQDDLTALTWAMARSGDTFDYRPFAERSGKVLLRRYPTGGISEKVALIMPSLCSALSRELPILSTVLVGRSLGFTGGTVDKLGIIPGFRFPQPGDETEEVLTRCGSAMCTTSDRVAPADHDLYHLRSRTGTIASEALIVASVASKHLALPPHRLLMDVRHGPGAFLSSLTSASRLAQTLQSVLHEAGIRTSAVLTETTRPGGSAVGNTLELAEALAVMGAPQTIQTFDPLLMEEQRDTVIHQTVELLGSELPFSRDHLSSRIAELFTTGRVLAAFNTLLCAHSVAADEAGRLCRQADAYLGSCVPISVASLKSGHVIDVDQVKIGNIVNFGFASFAATEVRTLNRSGVVLRRKRHDAVTEGDPLCLVYLDPLLAPGFDKAGLCALLRSSFRISDSPLTPADAASF